MRVLVVGAGLAGLSAAEALLNAGVDVTLIEAGYRPGGRTRTVRDRFRNGQIADSGAEWVDSIHWRYRELMARYGVVDEGDPAPWTTIRRWMFWDGRQVSGRELDRLEPDLFAAIERYEEATDAPAAALTDPSRPDRHPDATFLDSRSLADVITESDLGPAGRLLAARNAQGEFAAEPRQVSCLFVAQQRAHEREEARRQGIAVTANRVAGGTGQIAEGLARELSSRPSGRLSILFGHRLVAVEQDSDGIAALVRSSDGEVRIAADHVVLACSLVPLRDVEFRNPLPPLLAEAILSLGYGSITKTAVQFERREWVSGYGTTDSVSQRIYETTVDQTGDPGILMAYCGGEGGERRGTHRHHHRGHAAGSLTLVDVRRRVFAFVVGAPELRRRVRGVRTRTSDQVLAGVARVVGTSAPGRRARGHVHGLHGGRHRIRSCRRRSHHVVSQRRSSSLKVAPARPQNTMLIPHMMK